MHQSSASCPWISWTCCSTDTTTPSPNISPNHKSISDDAQSTFESAADCEADSNNSNSTVNSDISLPKTRIPLPSQSEIEFELTTEENSSDMTPLAFSNAAIKYLQKNTKILSDDSIFSFNFDIFSLSTQPVIRNRPLLVLGIFLLKTLEPLCWLFRDSDSAHNKHLPRLDLNYFAYFLDAIEKLYMPNPYHNNTHASDVLQFTSLLLRSKFAQKHFTVFEQLALIMAAASHDTGHNGKTNDFHKKIDSELAKRYNYVSILENFHITNVFEIMSKNREADWLSKFEKSEQATISDIVKEAILNTDMASYHKNIRETLKEKTPQFLSDDYNLTHSDRKFLCASILHLSDISNPLRPFRASKEWAVRINREFWAQGDEMKRLNLPLSFGTDRNTTSVPKTQSGFVQFFVLPLCTQLSHVFTELETCIETVKFNSAQWKLAEQQHEKEMSESTDSPLEEEKTG